MLKLLQMFFKLVYMKYNAFSERRKRERVSKKDGDWRRKDEKKQLKDDQAKKEKMRAMKKQSQSSNVMIKKLNSQLSEFCQARA